MTPNQWNRNTRDSVVRLLTQAGFSEDSSVINQLECMNFDEPAAPQSDDAMDGLVDAVKDVLDYLNDSHSIHSGTGLHSCLQAAYRAAMGSKGDE